MTRGEAKEILKTPGRVIPDVTAGNDEDSCRYNIENKMAIETAIKTLEQETCEDCISRSSLKKKFQEHHDFFVNAYGGFSNLPPKDKARVDEITHCIAEVVNMPSVKPKPKTGHWIDTGSGQQCSECGEIQYGYDNYRMYCAYCGAKMKSEG